MPQIMSNPTEARVYKTQAWQIFSVFLCFFISDDALLFSTIPSNFLMGTKIASYIILLVYLSCKPNLSREGMTQGLLVILLMGGILCLSMASNTDLSLNYGYRFFILLLCLLFATRIRFHEYAQIYVRVLFIFSLIALISWIFKQAFPALLSYIPSVTNSKGVAFPTIGVCSFLENGFRSTSIFREPGMFSIYLIWGLFLEIFYLPESSKVRVSVFSASTILTFSTLGFLSLITLFIVAGFRTRESLSYIKKNYWIILLAPIITTILLTNETVYSHMVTRNFGGEGIEDSAAFSRLSSFTVPLKIALESPFSGVGITSYMEHNELAALEIYGIALGEGTGTNTIMIETAKHGFLYGGILILLLLNLSRRFKGFWGIFALLLAMLSSQCMPYSIFYNLLLMYGASYVCSHQKLNALQGQKLTSKRLS